MTERDRSYASLALTNLLRTTHADHEPISHFRVPREIFLAVISSNFNMNEN